MNEDNIIDLAARRDKTVTVERREKSTCYLSCAYGSALLMRVHENGDVDDLSFNGETMDKICETWLAYRGNRQRQEQGG